MTKVAVNESSLQNIANAIRTKNGSQTTYKPSEMANAITSIVPTVDSSSITVTPSTQTQVFTPEENKYYNKVTCNAIPNQYIVPTGELEITQNGTYDVTSYASANVQISGVQPYRLPDTYQEVEYIESSGTQFFSVPYNANGYSQFEFKIYYKDNSGIAFGAYNGAWTSGCGYYHNNSGSEYEWVHYYSNTNGLYKGGQNVTETVEIDKGNLTINGTAYATQSSIKTFYITIPLYILAGNWSNQRAEQPLSAKLYYFIVKDNNEIEIMKLIPCYRKSDNEIGMYDIIHKQFYTNAGTGTFSKGADHNTPA